MRANQNILRVYSTTHEATAQEKECTKGEKTGNNRSTFYAHFQDVYDVVEKTERHFMIILLSGLKKLLLKALNDLM